MEEKIEKKNFFKKLKYSITKFEEYPAMAAEDYAKKTASSGFVPSSKGVYDFVISEIAKSSSSGQRASAATSTSAGIITV